MEHLNVLFLTYCYPPQKFPRSIQISHLVQYLRNDFNITVITSEPENDGDPSLLSFTPLDNVIYASKSNFTKTIERSKGHRVKKKILPDFQYLWHFDLLRKTRVLIEESSPDVIVTFGQPMSTHIAGLKLKQKYPHLKWISHFSDPWVDNLFNDYNVWTKWINQYYQDRVFKNADQLIFTSTETIDLVTKLYSHSVREKSVCLPHIFNQDLYVSQVGSINEKIILRYIGNFYGNRQPDSILKALQLLSPEQRAQIRIEFIGSSTNILDEIIQNYSLKDIVFISSPVSYINSLNLMHSADILLIIDAPTEKSPFLPSKLIDYIGANKPIFGITPPGTSQKLIEEMGFLVAYLNNPEEIARKLSETIQNIKDKRMLSIPDHIRQRYSVESVGKQMKKILDDVIN
ncbi:MAG: hypothetical protein HYS39_03430 [Proteobacteria bacterium]|nr:hypothetical protein [Pseudomonadota bacterium]